MCILILKSCPHLHSSFFFLIKQTTKINRGFTSIEGHSGMIWGKEAAVLTEGRYGRCLVKHL